MSTESNSKKLTDKKFWDTNWNQTALQCLQQPFSPYRFCRFHKLFEQYLPKDCHNKTLLEVGCVPGRHLVYFNKVFGFTVEGVDFSDHIGSTHDVMKYHGIEKYLLYQEDFLRFTHEPYDAVVSFGFLEHFSGWRAMLQKHIELVKPGGYLIVSVPNLCHFQYTLHKWLDPEFENEQVVESTRLINLEKIIMESGLQLLYSGYYQTFQFFCHHREQPRSIPRHFMINILRIIGAFFTRSKINIPSRHFSPQVICIARNGKT